MPWSASPEICASFGTDTPTTPVFSAVLKAARFRSAGSAFSRAGAEAAITGTPNAVLPWISKSCAACWVLANSTNFFAVSSFLPAAFLAMARPSTSIGKPFSGTGTSVQFGLLNFAKSATDQGPKSLRVPSRPAANHCVWSCPWMARSVGESRSFSRPRMYLAASTPVDEPKVHAVASAL
jgi:hypothetical protein